MPPAELLVNAVPLTSRLEFQTVMAPPSLPTLLAKAESSTVRLEWSCTYRAPAARNAPAVRGLAALRLLCNCVLTPVHWRRDGSLMPGASSVPCQYLHA